MDVTLGAYSKAVQYLEMGYSVIPVDKDKRAKVKWEKYQHEYATMDDLEHWFLNQPHNNIAIVTGEISGITVIDLDKHKGVDLTQFPEDTYTVKTGNGGLHLYYAYNPEAPTIADFFKDGKGVDIRNDGGYVVAPPSVITPKYEGEDGVYMVKRQLPVSPFPNDRFKFAKKKKAMSDRLNLTIGSRNTAITSIIGELLSKYPETKWESEVWPLVIAANNTYNPPLDESELKTTFESVAKLERGNKHVVKSIPSPVQFSTEQTIDILLRKNKSGTPHKDMVNAILAFEQHPAYAKTVRFNTFKAEIEINGKPMTEEDVYKAQYLLQNDIDLSSISKTTVYEALQHHAFNNKYDEAIDWLKSLQWDGAKRLERWLHFSCGVPDNLYHSAIGAQWMLGMVKRLVYAGSVFDHVLTVVGRQGIGKTSLFRIIGGDWYKSHTESVDGKDFYLKLRGACLIDLDEGATMNKSDSIKIKSIITETVDEYRAPYDRVTQKYPRRFVFSMSTNDLEPFRDQTGNRRYWIVKIEEKVNFAWLQDNRDQIFAEAYHALMNHVELPQVPLDEAERLQQEATVKDEWYNAIMSWVSKRRDYRMGDPEFSLNLQEVYEGALGGEDLHRLDRQAEMRIGSVLRNDLKMHKRRVRIDDSLQNRFFLDDREAKRLQEEWVKNGGEEGFNNF